jgi:ubiquinone/menaquinone biosynthesis C-methylase UbiE
MLRTRSVRVVVIALAVAGAQLIAAAKLEGQVWSGESEAPQIARMLEDLKAETVAEIGAGFGAFTAFLAKQVNSTVRITATELLAQIPNLSKGLEKQGASNVKVVVGAPESTNLPDNSCDAIIVRNTYHHFDQPAAMAASLFRTLRRGGTLFMIEWPRVQMRTGEWDGIMPTVLIEQLQRAGFIHQRTVDPFDKPLYLVVMRKP